ncbi:MAG: hypothetical protein ACREBD_18485 [Blastocatellia bacterium]
MSLTALRLAEVWRNRAVTLLRLDRLTEAEADFARCRELGEGGLYEVSTADSGWVTNRRPGRRRSQ